MKGMADMDCKQASLFMHDYLDDELPLEQAKLLKQHLQECPSCQLKFKELERTEMMLFASIHQHSFVASDDLVGKILNKIPSQERPKQEWLKWFRRHPALTAIAMFVIVTFVGVFSLWDRDDQLVVKGSNLDQLIIQGNTVIVPENIKVAGNLTIENGKAEIYGEVEGDVTVIDGSYFTASTAKISGHIQSIDQALDWIWYRITNTFSEVAYR